MAEGSQDYFSFEDVLGELRLDEDELKRMVSEGELRAFRDENRMKFRKDDVESLRGGHVTEPTIILPAGETSDGPSSDTSETLLDLDSMQEITASNGGPPSETEVPSLDFESSPEEQAFADDSDGGIDSLDLDVSEVGSSPMEETVAGDTTGITEEMDLADDFGDDLAVESVDDGLDTQDTFVDDDEETGLTTQPLDFAEDGEATIEEDAVEDGAEGAARPSRISRSRVHSAAPARAPKQGIDVLATPSLVLSTLFLFGIGIVLYDVARLSGERGVKQINAPFDEASQPLGMSHWVGSTVVSVLGLEKELSVFPRMMLPGGAPASAPMGGGGAPPAPLPDSGGGAPPASPGG